MTELTLRRFVVSGDIPGTADVAHPGARLYTATTPLVPPLMRAASRIVR